MERFGLALSGGGLRGVAHIGVLKALHNHGLYPSWISGSSAGSIIAGLYAYGYLPDDIEKIAYDINKSIIDPDYIGLAKAVLHWILGKGIHVDGIIKGENIEVLIKKLTKQCCIRDVKVPLAITAVNINTGQTIYFVSSLSNLRRRTGKQYINDVLLHEAIRSSIAIPVVFKPAKIKDTMLVDGGVTDNLPVEVLKDMGAKKIIGINLGYSGQMRRDIDNILEIGSQTIDIMAYHITKLKSSNANVIINPNIYNVGLSEIEKIPECINKGYKIVDENIEMIKKAIKK